MACVSVSVIGAEGWGLVGLGWGEEQDVMRNAVVTSRTNEKIGFIKIPQRALPIQVRSFLQVLLDLQ